MRLEYVWPHLPTPIFYAIVMVQVAAFLTIQNTNLATFVSLLVIALAFGASSLDSVRPFHIERLAVVAALVLSYLAVAEAIPVHMMEALHAHGTFVPYLIRLAYNLLWLLVASIALVGFWRNPTRRAPFIWVSAALFTLILALMPLDVALPIEATWIVLLRFNIAFFIYMAVALGDAAYLTEKAYRKVAKEPEGYDVLPDDVDITLIRTLSWIPLSVCALYIKPFFLVLPIAAFGFVAYITVMRWRLASQARDAFENGEVPRLHENFVRPGRQRHKTIQIGHDTVNVNGLSREQLIDIAVASNLRQKGLSLLSDTAPSGKRRKKKIMSD